METRLDYLMKQIDEYFVSPTDENLNKIKEFITKEAGYCINDRNYSDDTPLLKVVKKTPLDNGFDNHKKLALMQTLIELGADVNAKDLSTGKTPIMYTSDWREQEETKLLIKNNANIYLTDKNNKSCLDYLDEPNKKIVLCKDVLNGISNGNIEPNAKNSCGDTPLIVYGDLAASAFIKAGADVNIQGEYGKTALMTIKNPEAIKAVIAAGANIEAKDNYGNTAFNCAINNVEKAKLLIEAGADITNKNNAGVTALMSVKDKETLDLILDTAKAKGLDVNAMIQEKDNEGKSVLAHAFENHCSNEVIQTLIDHGASLHDKDNKGNEAFQYADANSYNYVKPILVDDVIKNIANEQNPEIRSNRATSLLTDVTNKEQAQALIELGGDVNGKVQGTTSVLMSAANNGNTDAAKILIEAGANVNDTDDAGHTALMYAVSQNKTSTASVLTDMGADVKARDTSGNNAMDYAQTAEMKSVLAAASVRQTKREKEAQTQTQAAPTRQTQVNMNVAARTQGGR